MSDTPFTDSRTYGFTDEAVHADFARKLERERDALRKEVNISAADVALLKRRCDALKAERDAANEELEWLRKDSEQGEPQPLRAGEPSDFEGAIQRMRDAERERDKVREALKKERLNAITRIGEYAAQIAGLTTKLEQVSSELARYKNDVEVVTEERSLALTAGQYQERLKKIYKTIAKEARRESEEQARLLGMGGSRETRLITERDHYKSSLEEISTAIQEYKDSIVQEPAEDFIWAIKTWADKKLKEI